LQVLVFGSFAIYASNQQEFSAPYWTLAVQLLPVAATATVVLALIAATAPRRLYPYFLVAMVGIGLVLWIQGNLIVGNYGVLNGEDINWAEQAWRTRYELALWIGVPVLAVAFAPRVLSTAVFTSRVMIALQALLLAYSTFRPGGEPHPKWQGAPEVIFELSSQRNVIHFVLDGFQSDAFHDIVDSDRAKVDRTFAGFTFYPNHAGAFPTTIVSIPAMLTGQAYRNDEPMRQFISKQFSRASLFGVMRSQGYRVDVISGLTFDVKAATNHYVLPTPYVTYEVYRRFAAWQLADLSLFRHSPHVAKPWIYNDQSWRLQNSLGRGLTTEGRRHLPVNGQAFLADFTRRMRIASDRPLYKYIHVGVPHWPMALDAECRYVGVKPVRRETYAGQSRCAIKRVGELLDRLRELGVYDGSLIVISSDHGIALQPTGFADDRDVFGGPLSSLAGSALAMLAVKPPKSTGPLRISGAPTSITDIPATIVDTLGLANPFGGTSALKLDEHAPRTRFFATYPWRTADWHADHFPYMDVFAIEGRVLDGQNWKMQEPIYPPGLDPGGRSRGFYRPERGGPGILFRWSSPLSFLHAPPGATGVELKVRSVSPTPQTLTVEIRGKVIDRITFNGDDAWRTLKYSLPASKPDQSEWVTLRVDPPWRVRRDPRTFGVMTRDLKWIGSD
jgi:hypothetical protein